MPQKTPGIFKGAVRNRFYNTIKGVKMPNPFSVEPGDSLKTPQPFTNPGLPSSFDEALGFSGEAIVEPSQATTPLSEITTDADREIESNVNTKVTTPKYGMLDTASAATHNFFTDKISRYVEGYYRDLNNYKDPDFKPQEAIDNVDIPLDFKDRNYLFEAGNLDNFHERLDRVRVEHDVAKVIESHPGVNFAVSWLDPMVLAVPAAINVMPLYKFGTWAPVVASAGVMGAYGAASVAMDDRPMTEKDIAYSALIHAAMGAALINFGMEVMPNGMPVPFKGARAPKIPQVQAKAGLATEKEVADVTDNIINSTSRRLEWSTHKTLRQHGEKGKVTADTLFDNVHGENHGDSIESIKIADTNELTLPYVHAVEDSIRSYIKETTGMGWMGQLLKPMKYRQAQRDIEEQIMQEMLNREAKAANRGMPFPPTQNKKILEMADKIDEMNAKAVDLMKMRGVHGSEDLQHTPGYLHRRYDMTAMMEFYNKMARLGKTTDEAKEIMSNLIATSMRSKTTGQPMPREAALAIARTMVERQFIAMRREDISAFSNKVTNLAANTANTLRKNGVKESTVKEVEQAMMAHADEAGTANYLKDRLDFDYNTSWIDPSGKTWSVYDFLDKNLVTNLDFYARKVGVDTAFAAKGIKTASDLSKFRKEFMDGVKGTAKEVEEASKDFDQAVGYLRGDPTGVEVHPFFRNLGALNRSVSLGGAGLWQIGDTATMIAREGAASILTLAKRSMPGFRNLIRPSKSEARDIDMILTAHHMQGNRIRPFIERWEDYFAMGLDKSPASAVTLSLQHAQNLTPFVNAQRYIQHGQAKLAALTMINKIGRAAKGDQKHMDHLIKNGLDKNDIIAIENQIEKHGMNVDTWDTGVWQKVSPSLYRYIDNTIINPRQGDTPMFLYSSPLGKFLGQFRSFIASAHNKSLVQTLSTRGLGGLSMLLMWQIPLNYLAVQAREVTAGNEFMPEKKAIMKSVSYSGGIGLLSDAFSIITGQSNEMGVPGMIPVDRSAQLLQGVTNLDAKKSLKAAIGLTPVIGGIPITKGLVNIVTEK